jgi:hypothetical protein
MLCIFSLIAKSSFASSNSDIDNGKYSPILDFSLMKAKNRTIREIGLMLPMQQNELNLIILDLKYKKDRKSYEYNLGLAYRRNNNDNWIFGIYGYFDRRKTENKLYANQCTVGTEILSRYFDTRLNFYIPENRKKIIYEKIKGFRRDYTRIFIDVNKFQEQTLPGYDIEMGVPLFGLIPKIDKKFGTKIYLAKYDFRRKNLPRHSGVRIRLEQKIFEDNLTNKPTFTMHLGTQIYKKKWDNFIGVNVRIPIGGSNFSKSRIQQRMMDIIVRDVDLRTEKSINSVKEPLYYKGNEIHNIYFIMENKKTGQCTVDDPCSLEQVQLMNNKLDKSIIIPVGNQLITNNILTKQEFIVDIKKTSLILETRGHNVLFNLIDYFPELQKEVFLTEDQVSNKNMKKLLEFKAEEDKIKNFENQHRNQKDNGLDIQNNNQLPTVKLAKVNNSNLSTAPLILESNNFSEKQVSQTTTQSKSLKTVNYDKMLEIVPTPLQEKAVKTMLNPRINSIMVLNKVTINDNILELGWTPTSLQVRAIKTMLKPRVDYILGRSIINK